MTQHRQSGIPALRLVARSRPWMTVFVGLSLVAGLSHSASANYNTDRVASFRSIRYEGVVAQTEWWTCGPAVLATLFTHFYDIPTSESDMLGPALQAMASSGKEPEEGITLLALAKALDYYGIPSKGYKLEPGDLESYFRRGGLPLIMHVTMPRAHYLVGIGVVSGHLIAADPSYGMRALSFDSLYGTKGFTGIVLTPVPPEHLLASAAEGQEEVLRRYKRRFARLRAWGGRR